jgi:hypothetical protein
MISILSTLQPDFAQKFDRIVDARRESGGFWLVFFEIPYFEVKDVDPLEDHGVQCW